MRSIVLSVSFYVSIAAEPECDPKTLESVPIITSSASPPLSRPVSQSEALVARILQVRGDKVSWLVSIGLEVMFYGAVVWDPWLILAQIVCLQCLFYLTLGVFMTIFVGTRVSRLGLVYFFDYATVTASIVTGWCVIAAFVLSSLAGAVYLLYLVERAKKCLDFSATLYIIHLFICIAYGGWPSSITWWVVNGIGLAIMSLLGEYLCIKRELREIPISRYRPSV